MKTISILLALALSTCSWAAPAVHSIFVIVSPFYAAGARQEALATTLKLLETAPLGTEIHYIDGWNLTSIATVKLPASLLADSGAARRPVLREGIARLLAFFKATEPAPTVDLKASGAIDLPRALQLIPTGTAAAPRAVLVLASPIHQSPRQPQFSFLPDFVPSDANLFVDPKYSVFSVRGLHEHLINTRIFVRYPSEGAFCSGSYRTTIERFWSLYITYQAGRLAGFSAWGSDTLDGLFDSTAPSLRSDGIDPAQNKVEMISERIDVPHRTITLAPAEINFVEATPTGAAPAAKADAPIIAQLSRIPYSQTAIGIMWDIDGMDLDLYCWAKPDLPAGPLGYNNTSTPEGVYLHDYQDRNDHVAYEQILLNFSPEPLHSMRAFVNIYKGAAPGQITGKVFLRHKGVTKTGTFTLAGRSGNRGADMAQRESSPFWTEIKLDDLQPVAGDVARTEQPATPPLPP